MTQETPPQASNVVRIFSARACAAPLEKAAALFTEQTGIAVEISVCARHCAKPEAEEAVGTTGGDDFLLEIQDAGIHDLAIAGAEYLLDDGEVRGMVCKGQRRTIAYRCSGLMVQAGNPKGITSLADLARPGMRIAVSVLDCLKGLWEDLTARLGLLGKILPNITFRANGCVAIVEAVAQDKVDAAISWSAFKHLEPDRIQIIELPPEQQIFRGTSVGLLDWATNVEGAKQFMDFLASPASQAFYKEFGWVTFPD